MMPNATMTTSTGQEYAVLRSFTLDTLATYLGSFDHVPLGWSRAYGVVPGRLVSRIMVVHHVTEPSRAIRNRNHFTRPRYYDALSENH